MSFCNVEVDSGGFKNIFAGLSNYIRAFTVDPEFNQMLVEEIGSMCINALAVMVFSFFVAMILNEKFKGRAFVRAIFFLPVTFLPALYSGWTIMHYCPVCRIRSRKMAPQQYYGSHSGYTDDFRYGFQNL